ncbi:MAG: hypothetical protein WB711_23580 [Terriglobales bacterium]
MRHLLLLSVLLLSACWAAAQTYSGQSGSTHSTSTGSTTTIEGCLSSNNGSYTLTDSHGKIFDLAGDTSKLSEHIGHTVKITGTSTAAPASSSSSAMGQTSSSHETIDVSSVKHISKTCKNSMSH